MTVSSEFDVHDHVWTLIDNKPIECIVRTVEFPTIVSTPNPIRSEDDKVIYHLVTKAEETQRRNTGMAILNTDYEFTRHANEVAESAQALLRRMLNEYEIKRKISMKQTYIGSVFDIIPKLQEKLGTDCPSEEILRNILLSAGKHWCNLANMAATESIREHVYTPKSSENP